MKEIPRKSVVERLCRENPWWEEAPARPYADYQPRPYIELLLPLLDFEIRRAVILMGPRRVGKTVLLHHVIDKLIAEKAFSPRHVCFVSVDNPLYNSMGLHDFLEIYKEATAVDFEKERCIFMFDEIQYLKNWEQHLKSLIDSFPEAKFVASGSAAAALKLKSNESGAGRFTDLLLPPLTFYEYVALKRKEELFRDCCRLKEGGMGIFSLPSRMEEINDFFLEYLALGGYPEVALNEAIRSDPSRFIKSDIVDKVLLRDLPSLYGIEDIQELNSLFTTLAYNTAGEISPEVLSKDAKITKNTIKKYIEYLEAAFLIRHVDRVDINAKRFKRNTSFKVYLTNPSIRTALFAQVDPKDSDTLGALVETAVFAQWFHSEASNAHLHYARWPKGEVDIVYLGPEQKPNWAIEVKWSNRYFKHRDELLPQIEFCKKHHLKKLLVTSIDVLKNIEHEGVVLEFCPASLYCYMLGYNVLEGKKKPPRKEKA